ncbi:hypothetical protein Tco_1154059 [Tanacetum coccineum]
MYETRQTTIPFPSRLNGYYYEEKKGSYGPQFLEAYSEASHINNSIPRKEKDLGSFTLPCFINNVCFGNALVDLGVSVSVMPLSTYLNLGLGKLAHTKLIVELADRTVKYLKGIAENILVEIGKFIFPVDFIILDMPEDIKVPLILESPFLSIARAKIDVYKRNITLRVKEERIVFTSVKPAGSLIKKVYMPSLRERMELDLEARLMGETLVLNRSLDPFFEDYIELNDINEPFELRSNQGNDLIPTIEEGEVIKEFRTKDDELYNEIDDYPSYYDYDKKIHIDYAHNLKFSCMIGFEFTHANFFPLFVPGQDEASCCAYGVLESSGYARSGIDHYAINEEFKKVTDSDINTPYLKNLKNSRPLPEFEEYVVVAGYHCAFCRDYLVHLISSVEAYTPVTIDIESELEEAPSEIEEFEAYDLSDTRITSPYSTAPSDSTTLLSSDHALAQTSPAPTRRQLLCLPLHFIREDTEDKSLDSNTKREGLEDKGHGSEDEDPGSEEEEEALPKVALRRHELALREGSVPSIIEIGQSSRSMLEQQMVEETPTPRPRVRATWVDPMDGTVYTDILVDVPPVRFLTLGISFNRSYPAATIAVGEAAFLRVESDLELHGRYFMNIER